MNMENKSDPLADAIFNFCAERVANQSFESNKENTVTLTGFKQKGSTLRSHCISEPCLLFSFQSSVTLLTSIVEEFHCSVD